MPPGAGTTGGGNTGPGHGGGDDAETAPVRLVTTTVSTPRRDTGRHAAPDTGSDSADGPGPDDRGSLSIADVVVQKVATVAATEIDGVGGAARRVLGVPTSSEDGDGRPRVSASVRGGVAALEVRLSVVYPASVRRTTEAVRAHLRDRVEALTELTVSRVDIDVVALTRESAPTVRVIA